MLVWSISEWFRRNTNRSTWQDRLSSSPSPKSLLQVSDNSPGTCIIVLLVFTWCENEKWQPAFPVRADTNKFIWYSLVQYTGPSPYCEAVKPIMFITINYYLFSVQIRKELVSYLEIYCLIQPSYPSVTMDVKNAQKYSREREGQWIQVKRPCKLSECWWPFN